MAASFMGISSETSSESSDNEDEWGLGNNGIGSIVQHALRMARRMHIQEIVQETDSGEEESEGESEEEDINFQERYELFVGNLPNDIRRDSLRLALNDRLSVNSVVDVKDLIRPARGRAFAFVRCNSERAFEELVNAEVTLGGRVLRIARSRRVTPRRISASQEDCVAPEANRGNSINNTSSAFQKMREEALKEISSLSDSFEEKFESTQKALQGLREKRREKEEEKDNLENQISSLKSRVFNCDSEIASLTAEICDKEKSFDTYAHEHSARVDGIRERIKKLRDEKQGDNTESLQKLPDGLRDDLDCICCFETMGLSGAAIYQCHEGHLICPQCLQRLEQCPICRQPYTKPPIRSRISEQLAASIKITT